MNVSGKPKKILMITSRSDIGGGPKHLYDLLYEMNTKGSYQISVAAPLEEPFEKKFRRISHNFLPIPKRRFSLYSFLKLLIFCINNEIEIIHSHGRGAGTYSRLLGFFNFKIVHTFHGAHRTNDWVGSLKVLTDKFLSHLTDKFICVSEDEMKTVLNLRMGIKEKIEVIENGINTEELKSQNTRAGQSKVTTVGTLARLNHQKGIDIAIEFFSKLDLNITLLVAGEGEDKDSLLKLLKEKGAEKKVKFIGPVNSAAELFNQVDAYISTARWEGLPLSVLEAMAFPNACLLSDVIGHGAFFEEDTCIAFDIEDFNSFREGLLRLIEEKEILEKRAEKLVNTRFGLNQMVKKVENLYKNL